MNRKTVLLITALSITSIPQQTQAAQVSDTVVYGAVALLGTLGIMFGVSYGVKSAQLAQEQVKQQAAIALVADVSMIDPYKKFNDIFTVIQESNNNNRDAAYALARHLASKNVSIKSLKNQLIEYEEMSKKNIEKLAQSIVLWRTEKTYETDFIEKAESALKKIQYSNYLQKTANISSFIKQEETFLRNFSFLAGILHASYNYDDQRFPLLETIKEMHRNCELLQKAIDELLLCRSSNNNAWQRYTDLIEDAQKEQGKLQGSIKNIVNSNSYVLQKKEQEQYNRQQQELEIHKQKVQADLLRQQRYQDKNVRLNRENKELREEKDKYKQQLNQEEQRILNLKKEIENLKQKISLLEQELALLRNQKEQDAKKITATEQQLAQLKEKLDEFLRKLNNPGFNPDNENLSKEALAYRKIIKLASFEIV